MYHVQEFGEIGLVWKKVPEGGLLLREDDGVVLLEQYLDAEGKNIDVVHQFEDECTLSNKADLCECLATAREYLPDLNVPIYIKSISARYNEDEEEQKTRKAYYEKLVARCGTHPWSYFMH